MKPADLSLPPPAEGSAEVAARIAKARAMQAKRYGALPEDRRIRINAEADGGLLDEVATHLPPRPKPVPNAPGMFGFADRDHVTEVVTAAGCPPFELLFYVLLAFHQP